MRQVLNVDSKEAIKARMLQNAATLWGIKNPQALDPFVKLLIEAFAAEIFRLSNETERIEARLVEKIARLLTPSIYTIPQPAHAIARALPLDPICILNSEQEFRHSIILPAQYKGDSETTFGINFTAVDGVELSHTDIACIATGYGCKWFDAKMNRSAIAYTNAMPINYGEMWLALDISKMGSDFPESLSFYFANPAFEQLQWIYQLLPYATASIAGHPLIITPGLSYISKPLADGYEEIFNDFDIQRRITDDIKKQYDPQFITLTGFPDQIKKQVTNLPASLCQNFTAQDVESNFTKPYLWLKLKFPPQYTFDILDQFFVSLNAFPLINRKWEHKDYKVEITSDNIPIESTAGTHFLSVQKVQDDHGRHYTEIPYGGINNMATGHYSVRRSGMERYDKRSALDIANYMLELGRDEVAAFGSLTNSDGKEPAKEIVIHLNRLERAAKEIRRTALDAPVYIVIEPQEKVEQINLGYWVTNGTLANNFRAGQILKADTGALLADNTLTLLSATRGGDGPQTGTDSINAYRYALTSRDRIVTFLDIKNFCQYELKGVIKSVLVKKGTALSSKPKEGFVRTTDIFITVINYSSYPQYYWQAKEQELIQKIDARAVDGVTRRVFIAAENKNA
ncbi:hypothetical protein DN068_12865 [Taibaiella soli]|uniref:Uncharacterized protein n=2 Tax=Taibaiella soli TaxID=1649169 RepID=A0A2W2ABF1_9BACT|nr:hypothetical protein DN068_12865 [Taibaiella soli]